MASYLEEPDTDSDEEIICELTEEQKNEILQQCLQLKEEGNLFFKDNNYQNALEKYTVSFTLSFLSFLLSSLNFFSFYLFFIKIGNY